MNKRMTSVLWAGVIAGTVDIGAACLINGVGPDKVLRAVASGLIGRAAIHGGAWVPVLGMALQWAMSILIAAIYVAAVFRLATLRQRWLPAGIACGVVVFCVMNYVVVPLSAAVFKVHFTPQSFALNMLAMLVFGLIVAYLTRSKPGAAG